MSYVIEIPRRAEKDLDQLDRMAEKRVRERLKLLSCQPTAWHLSQPVKMAAGIGKSRLREWRIFFEVDEINRKIVILSVRHRQLAYQNLKLNGRGALIANLDREVLEWFKAQGKGYQSRLNAVLRAYKEAHNRAGMNSHRAFQPHHGAAATSRLLTCGYLSPHGFPLSPRPKIQ